MSPTTPPGRTLTPKGQRTRAALVDAAYQLFNSTSFPSVRVTDITATAGVASGTFYVYFSSKEQIFHDVALQVLDEMLAAPTRPPREESGDPIQDIADATRRYFMACRKHAGVARAMEQIRSVDTTVAHAQRRILVEGAGRSERWIRRLQAAGVCDEAIEPWPTAVALQAMTVSLAYEQIIHRNEPHDIDALVHTVTHIWARTVRLE